MITIPGAANAFTYGGFFCGIITLFGDILKGFLPVYCYLLNAGGMSFNLTLVLAAPVIGHILPVFYHFKGGKGIAVTFGCLLGLFPDIRPALILAAAFIFFSLIIRIIPTLLQNDGGLYRSAHNYVFYRRIYAGINRILYNTHSSYDKALFKH